MVKHSLKQNPALKVVTKKPITAAEEERATNPRSRSAKLRVAEKLPEPDNS
jgi:16S rRNA (cytosine1402-N4)-methyltransferase